MNRVGIVVVVVATVAAMTLAEEATSPVILTPDDTATGCSSTATEALDLASWIEAGNTQPTSTDSECQITLQFCVGAPDCHAVNCPGWTDTGYQSCQLTLGHATAERGCPSGQTWHVRTCPCNSPGGGFCSSPGTFAACM